jgi:hypothetical protein
VPGLLEGVVAGGEGGGKGEGEGEVEGEGGAEENITHEEDFDGIGNLGIGVMGVGEVGELIPKTPPKTARCKRCGVLISRSMDAIEAHAEECEVGRQSSVAESGVIAGIAGSKTFAGIKRDSLLDRCGTKIIYRTAKQGGRSRPREVCCLQDSFVDEEGVCYLYEISVRHSEVLLYA